MVQTTIETAERAIEMAVHVRELHRKRSERGASNRETDIRVAQHHIRVAMAPIRRELGKRSTPDRERLLEVSARLQRERRKLWKMSDPTRRKKKHGKR